MSTVRNVARVPRRAIEESEAHRASLPALIPPADPTPEPAQRGPGQPNPWAETLAVFFFVATIGLTIYTVAIGLLSLASYLLSAR